MFSRLKLRKRLQEVDLRPGEAWARVDRVQTHTSSAEDHARFARLMRATTAVTDQLRGEPLPPALSPPRRLSPERSVKRQRQLAKAALVVSGAHPPPMKDTVLHKPTGRVRLSSQAGEAILDRVSVYAPSRSDCEVLIEVVRWDFWLVWLMQEAKMRLKTLRTLRCGHGPKPPALSSPAVGPACASPSGDDEAEGAASSGAEDVGSSANAVSPGC